MHDSTERCDCGGERELRPIERVWVKRRGQSYFAPNDIQVLTCTSCKSYVIPDELFDQIDVRVREQIAETESKEIDGLLQRLEHMGVSRKEASKLLGVHYTYLSKVAKGKRVAGESFATLLDVLTNVPEALTYLRSRDETGRERRRAFLLLWSEQSSANDNAFAVPAPGGPRPRKKSYVHVDMSLNAHPAADEDLYKVCGA